jgi:hypothetical protein
MATADPDTPIFFTKIDIKDGYWRMRVCNEGKWNFTYTLPPLSPTHELILVICLALAMGWLDSPPFFCAVTETARDIMHEYEAIPDLPPHPLEHHMLTLTHKDLQLLEQTPLPPTPTPPSLKEVYMDDFIALCQARHITHLQHHSRAMLHAIHDLFPPPAVTGSTMEDPISISKLTSEGPWSTTKEVLGWVLNGQHRTVSITQAKGDSLTAQLNSMLHHKRVNLKQLVKLQGKLNWLSNALVTGKPLLGEMDMFLQQQHYTNHRWITLPPHILTLLTEWKILIKHLHARPISVYELRPATTPAYQGWGDASTSWGTGGVWFGAAQRLLPLVWFLQWPPDILQAIQDSTISINTLELFTILVQHLVLEAAVLPATLHHASVAIWCDNTTAVAWANKLRNSSCHLAHRILRLLTTRLIHNHESPFTTTHISGAFNTLADFASRDHPVQALAFLTAFTSTFPPPQEHFWTLCRLPNETQQKLFSLLRPEPPNMASLMQLNLNDSAFGHIGKTSSNILSQHTSPSFRNIHCQPDSPCWVPSLHLFGLANTNTPVSKSVPRQSYWHSAPSPRPTCWMDNRTPWLMKKANGTSSSNARLNTIDEMILPLNTNSHYHTSP